MKRIVQLLLIPLLALSGCHKDPYKKATKKVHLQQDRDISLTLKNVTDKPLYAAVFYYANKELGYRWTWYKSEVKELAPGQLQKISMHEILNQEEPEPIYGYLGIFYTKKEAQDSVYELLTDDRKIDLGLLKDVYKQILLVQTLSSGVQGSRWTCSLEEEINNKEKAEPHTNVSLLNESKKNLWIVPFVYIKQCLDYQWAFQKMRPVLVKNTETKELDIPITISKKDLQYVKLFLGIFQEHEEEKAQKSTFASLNPHEKIVLGSLHHLMGNTIKLEGYSTGVFSGTQANENKINFALIKKQSKKHKN